VTIRHAVSSDDFERDGYSVHERVLDESMRGSVVAAFGSLLGPHDGAGERNGLAHPAIPELARSSSVRALLEPILGAGAYAFRATLFDKTQASNWPVAWHQDRVIPVVEPRLAPGFAQWSQKANGWHVEPPRTVQERIVAVRVDLDGSGALNGGLRFVVGSHTSGVLDPSQIATAVEHGCEVCPNVVAGGAVRMRPLLLHSSRRIDVQQPPPPVPSSHRRIVHFEFFSGDLPHGVQFSRRVAGHRE
tara:strand:- start:23997 stop:24734 length:738 start_codon:yes stop_codon:yes gene_type:complete